MNFPASAAGWQEHNVDGVTMYLNPTTGEISRTPPATRSSEADLPPGWVSKTNENGKPYYVGPLLSANGETKMYMQHDRPTWVKKPDAIRLSPTWKVFSTNETTRMYGQPLVVVYENRETHEKTFNFPLASGNDLKKILDDEDAQAAASSGWETKMYDNGRRGGKNKRKQSKRKQSKRNATRRRMM